jgi:hypothetical protein
LDTYEYLHADVDFNGHRTLDSDRYVYIDVFFDAYGQRHEYIYFGLLGDAHLDTHG